MQVIGLTGGVGMGKSVAADYLARRGLPVVDTDRIARELVEPGQEALEEIRRAFGAEIVDEAGRLRRAELARRVFQDPEERVRLEAILHPRIREVWLREVRHLRERGFTHAVVVIPLLFETKAEACCDRVVCVACSDETQRERLSARGWSEEMIDQRNRAQWPIEQKMQQAHAVVWNEGLIEVLHRQLDLLLERLGAVALTSE